jgi:hypothetical protein
MSKRISYLSPLLLVIALSMPLLLNGCAVRASYRVYDPAYEDYHVWDRNEAVYYQRWEVESHHDHRDFRTRNSAEQKEYWTWRHAHHDDDR